MSVFEIFLKIPIFKGVSLDRLHDLIPKIALDFEDFQAGCKIFEKNEEPSGIFFLLSGHVKLTNDNISKEFSDQSLISFTGLFGNDMTYNCDAFAVVNSRILVIDVKSLVYLLKNDDNVLNNYLELLTEVTDSKKSIELLEKINV